MRRLEYGGRREALGGRLTPGVSVIMPACNEAASIVPAVRAMAPVLELAGLVLFGLGTALGVVNLAYFWLFMAVAYGFGLVVTLSAMIIEELSFPKYRRWRDLGVALLACVAETLGYRQATAWWRVQGWWASLRGRAQVWGTMTRTGFASGQGGENA
jgi:hypothetical protein